MWVVTGDGDGLSIGGNHLIHCLRRNVDLNILLFNNRIYGLTKGQYSPTSEVGKVTKSTPDGLGRQPVQSDLAWRSAPRRTFVGRTDRRRAEASGRDAQARARARGTSFVEILQNCNIFNDGAFNDVTDKQIKADHQLVLEHGKPLIFGKNRDKGIRLNGQRPEVVKLGDGVTEADLVVHDETDLALAFMLGNFEPPLPTPIGVFYAVSRPTYDGAMNQQIADAKAKQGAGDLKELLNRGDTWNGQLSRRVTRSQ